MANRCRPALLLALCAVVATLQAVGSPHAAAAPAPPTPERLFAAAAPGMVKIVTSCKSGLFVGSGFLVGPRTMVTALHVLRPPHQASCTVNSVKQEGTGAAAVVDHFDPYQVDDLAVAHLSAPFAGFYFGIAPKEPGIGTRVVALGYSLGNPLSFNQGTVVALDTVKGIPYIGMNLLGGHGSSGGPILDLEGRVVGLTQRGLTNGAIGVVLSIDLGVLAPNGRSLCQGIGRTSPSTLCGSRAPGVVDADSSSRAKTAQPTLAKTTPPTIAAKPTTARAYNAQTIGDEANHIPSPPVTSGDWTAVPEWNAYLRLALIANQDPYGRRYQSTYLRCWLPAAFRRAAGAGSAGQVFMAGTGPLGFYAKSSSWVNVSISTCNNAAKAARGQLTQTTVVALGTVLHETFNRQGIRDEGDLACLGAIGVWEAVNRHVGQMPADRAWALLLDWYSGHLTSSDLRGFNNCVARFNTDWNG